MIYSKLKLNMKFRKSDIISILFGIVTTLIVAIVFFIGNWLYENNKNVISTLLYTVLSCGIIPAYLVVSKKVPDRRLFGIAVIAINIISALILQIIGFTANYEFWVSVHQVVTSGFFVIIFGKFLTDENINDFRLAFLFCILLAVPFWGMCIVKSNNVVRDIFTILYALISVPLFFILQLKANRRFLYFIFVLGCIIAVTFPTVAIVSNNMHDIEWYMLENLIIVTLAHWAVLIIDFILLVFKRTE